MPLQLAPGELLNTQTETSVVYPQRYVVDQNGAPLDPIEGTSSRAVGGVVGSLQTVTQSTTFTFTQTTPAIVWDVVHDLNKYPSVTVVNTLGQVVQPDIDYVSMNEIKISFAFPYTGSVYLN